MFNSYSLFRRSGVALKNQTMHNSFISELTSIEEKAVGNINAGVKSHYLASLIQAVQAKPAPIISFFDQRGCRTRTRVFEHSFCLVFRQVDSMVTFHYLLYGSLTEDSYVTSTTLSPNRGAKVRQRTAMKNYPVSPRYFQGSYLHHIALNCVPNGLNFGVDSTPGNLLLLLLIWLNQVQSKCMSLARAGAFRA